MVPRVKVRVESDRSRSLVLPLLLWILFAVLAVAFSAAPALGGVSSSAQLATNEETEVETDGEENGEESVAMAFELEQDGAIDLEISVGEVSIDTWEGDEVLLIVRKTRNGGTGSLPSDPVSIQVTRRGKDIHIAALGAGIDGSGNFDVSFRIMVPRWTMDKPQEPSSKYDLSKLTSVVFKALHNEALRWIAR